MQPDLDRLECDLATIQKALGLVPSAGREWIRWMKRDKWFSLWWSLPGFILIAAALLPLNRAGRFLGFGPDRWAGILAALSMLAISIVHSRKITSQDGRPAGLIREAKRINGMTTEGVWFAFAIIAQVGGYFLWSKVYRIPFEPFWAGLFILTGSSCLAGAVAARAWALLGWAIPFLGYGICVPFAGAHGKLSGVLLGAMFVAVALSFTFISSLQIRLLERQNESH
jgi:hypothetical protein